MDENKILIADDEINIRSLVKGVLGEAYHVIEASDGEEAVKMARTHRPVLILMDIMMPNVDGYMACHAIKSDPELKEIPVIMLTGINSELNKKLGKRFSANGYLLKPFDLNELQNVVERLLIISQ